jgi:signal transduction histidine kinase
VSDIDARLRAQLLEIGHDLHDGPIQAVVSVVLELDGFRHRVDRDRSLDTKELANTLERSRRVLQDALEDLRAAVRRLGSVVPAPSDGGIGHLMPDAGAAGEVAWSEASEVAP